MALLLVSHESSRQHLVPSGHPERPARVDAAIAGLRTTGTSVVDIDAPMVDRHVLELVHDSDYIDEVEAFCGRGGGGVDGDTFAVGDTWEAAMRAAGGGPAAVEGLRGADAATAFVAVRPPGHHAERNQAMGFCFFNNAAVTAAYLRSQGERVAIVDWDVHHGNGTQHSFYDDPSVLYVSLHEFPFYPGTGWVTEVGSGQAAGTTVNIPVPAGTAASSYLAAFNRIALPVIEQFSADWLLVSAGFDAHLADPIGDLTLASADFGTMATSLASIVPANRTVAFLEGGYDLAAVETGARMAAQGALGLIDAGVLPTQTEGSLTRISDLVVEAVSPYWEVR